MNHRLVRRWVVPTWVAAWWSVLLALLAFLVAVAQVLDRQVKHKDWAWVHSPWLQGALAIALASVVFFDSARRAFLRFRSASEAKLRRTIRNQLGAVVAMACDVTPGLVPGDLGAGLFMMQKRGRQPSRLVRVERVRLLDKIGESGLHFELGMATVGKCWEVNNTQHHDWTRINRKWLNGPPDEERWLRMSDEAKHGLDYQAWRTLLGRYSEVLAVPVTAEGGKLIGVIALDRRWHDDAGDPPAVLNKRPVKEAAGQIARVLGADLA